MEENGGEGRREREGEKKKDRIPLTKILDPPLMIPVPIRGLTVLQRLQCLLQRTGLYVS